MSKKSIPMVTKSKSLNVLVGKPVAEAPIESKLATKNPKRESVEEFLKRGGSIARGNTRKAKGFVSLSSGPKANGAPSSSARAKRAESKVARRL